MRTYKFRVWDGSSYRELKSVKDFEDENLIVEEYIGLQDMKGKDIYEGDIVFPDELKWVGYAVYHYDGFMLIDDHGGFSSPSWGGSTVLGNIHENPELIGRK